MECICDIENRQLCEVGNLFLRDRVIRKNSVLKNVCFWFVFELDSELLSWGRRDRSRFRRCNAPSQKGGLRYNPNMASLCCRKITHFAKKKKKRGERKEQRLQKCIFPIGWNKWPAFFKLEEKSPRSFRFLLRMTCWVAEENQLFAPKEIKLNLTRKLQRRSPVYLTQKKKQNCRNRITIE